MQCVAQMEAEIAAQEKGVQATKLELEREEEKERKLQMERMALTAQMDSECVLPSYRMYTQV